MRHAIAINALPPTKGRVRGGPRSQSGRVRAPLSRTTPGVTTRSRAAHREPSPSPEFGKRSRVSVKSSDDEGSSSTKQKRTNACGQENAATGSASTAASQEETAAAASPDGTASDVSSPVRRPYLVREPWDMANILPFQEENSKYGAKIVDKFLKRCSGFLIGWDKDIKRGAVLTSANLLCTRTQKFDDWSCPRKYAPDVEVQIHLLDDTTQKGTLINYHKHYNIAVFEVDMDMPIELPRVSTEQLVDYGQEVFLIGRDDDLNLNASHGRVQCIDPGYFDHYHYMYLECEFVKVLM